MAERRSTVRAAEIWCRVTTVDGHALKPIHDWVKNYQRTWSERFDELDVVLEELKEKEAGDGANDE